MTVTQYLSSLPMDTRFYLLDYSNEPDKIKEVIGKNADDNIFFKELMKTIKDMQAQRITETVNKIKANDDSFKVPEYLISAMNQPFTKRCRNCGAVIESGNYCPKCAKGKAKENYGL